MNVLTDENAILSIADAELAKRVQLSLEGKDRELGRLSVELTSPDTVHLSGAVRSYYLRQLAIATASHVAGVRAVSDGIHVVRVESPDE